MALGQDQQIIPALAVKEIQDVYLRQNFQNLSDYFSAQNQLINFNFFEIVFTKATDNYKLAHNLTFAPLDILLSQLTGSGSVSFNIGLSDDTYLNISCSDACRVRFYVGKFWNLITSTPSAPTDVFYFSPAVAASSSSSLAQKTITAAKYNVAITDGAIFADCTNGPISIVLPGVAVADQFFMRVQKIDSTANVCTVSPNNPGAEFIRGAASVALSSQWSVQSFYCVKPNWYY